MGNNNNNCLISYVVIFENSICEEINDSWFLFIHNRFWMTNKLKRLIMIFFKKKKGISWNGFEKLTVHQPWFMRRGYTYINTARSIYMFTYDSSESCVRLNWNSCFSNIGVRHHWMLATTKLRGPAIYMQYNSCWVVCILEHRQAHFFGIQM